MHVKNTPSQKEHHNIVSPGWGIGDNNFLNVLFSDLIPPSEDYELARLAANLDLSAEDLRDYTVHEQLDIPLPEEALAKIMDAKHYLDMHADAHKQQNNR